MKSVLHFVSPKIFELLRIFVNKCRLIKEYYYDINRYFNFSDFYFNDGEEKLIMRIIHRYHPIEKGLTMSKMKQGFGVENILKLCDDCIAYKNNYLKNSKINSRILHYKHAINLVLEYEKVHLKQDFQIDNRIKEKLNYLLTDCELNSSANQLEFDKSEYFMYSRFNFSQFAESRHSLRHFVGDVNLNSILESIRIAQSSPSACNRQPSRVHILKDSKTISQVLDLQGGNRGFGHQVSSLLIIAAELTGYRGISERNNVYIDGGIFSMNLLLSLHHNEIGTCCLNWCTTPNNDIALRKLIDIPDSQTVILMIACGEAPDHFKVTCSPKNNLVDIITMH